MGTNPIVQVYKYPGSSLHCHYHHVQPQTTHIHRGTRLLSQQQRLATSETSYMPRMLSFGRRPMTTVPFG
jgi:hypothetical protein